MKGLIKILFLILSCFTIFSCKEKEFKIDIIRNKYKDLRLVNYRYGNFTNSNSTEILAYYNSKSIKEVEKHMYDVASLLVVFIIIDNKIINEYECAQWNGAVYSEDKDVAQIKNIQIVENKNLNFGKWDGYTYVSDYNGNGLDEILLFSNSPETFLPYIFEFHDGKMKTVLDVKDYDDFDNNVKTWFDTTAENGQKFIEIQGDYYGKPTDPVEFEKYKWNEKTAMYELVEKGKKPKKFE